jgi:hypothetical protein
MVASGFQNQVKDFVRPREGEAFRPDVPRETELRACGGANQAAKYPLFQR